MTARSYNFDQNAAKDANSGGKRIKEAGKFVGKFRAAWYEQNERGTESVNFLFNAANGQEAGPLTLYTHNGKGETLPSYDTFHAILACLKVRSIVAKPGKVELYDFDSKQNVIKQKEIYPDLMDKPIGLVLQLEEYEARDMTLKERLVIVGPFEAATGLMANEILAKSTTPVGLQRLIDYVTANPVKRLKGRRGSAQQQPATASRGQVTSDFVDDDIPF
jgi:hypothetical protein